MRLLADHGPEAMVIAGGTDVVPNLQMRLFTPRVLVDLKPLRMLSGVEFSEREGLRIGALTTLSQLLAAPIVREKFPVLASAVANDRRAAAAQYGNASAATCAWRRAAAGITSRTCGERRSAAA